MQQDFEKHEVIQFPQRHKLFFNVTCNMHAGNCIAFPV